MRASRVDVADLRRQNGDVEAADETVRRRRERARTPGTISAGKKEEKRAMVRVLEMSWRLNGEEHLLRLVWGGRLTKNYRWIKSLVFNFCF